METAACEPLRRAANEALSVGVGLGILGFNRLQVQRRAWERASGVTLPSMKDLTADLTAMVGGLTALLVARGSR